MISMWGQVLMPWEVAGAVPLSLVTLSPGYYRVYRSLKVIAEAVKRRRYRTK